MPKRFSDARGYEINGDVESMAHGVGIDEEMLLKLVKEPKRWSKKES